MFFVENPFYVCNTLEGQHKNLLINIITGFVSGCAEERERTNTLTYQYIIKIFYSPAPAVPIHCQNKPVTLATGFFYFYENSWLSLFDIFMGSYSIGEAINLLMQKSGWKPKVNELRLRQEWEAIAGKTISKYTRNLYLSSTTLTIYTDVAPLKQELLLGKEQLAARINEYFEEPVVVDIVIK